MFHVTPCPLGTTARRRGHQRVFAFFQTQGLLAPYCIRPDDVAQYLNGLCNLKSGERHHQRTAGHPISKQEARYEARRVGDSHTADALCTDRSVSLIPPPALQLTNAARPSGKRGLRPAKSCRAVHSPC